MTDRNEPIPSTPTLLTRLRAQFPTAKNQTLKQMVSDARVTVNGKRATKLSQALAAGDVVRVDERGRKATSKPTLAPLRLVHEDEDLLVIDKPAGVLTSTVPRERRPTALAIVRRYVAATSPHARARVGLIHRLDRDASGLLVFSKSDLAYQSLKTQFFKHTVERMYEAMVHGSPNPRKGRIDTHLVERADGSVHSAKQHGRGERAITDYEVIDVRDGRARVRVTLQTGRKHQIRAHLSEGGWPIVGDVVYGRGEPGGLKLRAVRLALDQPRSGVRMTFNADRLPE